MRSPLWSPSASPTPATPKSPGVTLTMEDGQRVTVPSHVLRAAVPADKPKEGQLNIFDSGCGGVDMATKLAKEGHSVIVHIKNSFAGSRRIFSRSNFVGCLAGRTLRCGRQ